MMGAAEVFRRSEDLLDGMQASGLSGQEIAEVLMCACVQNCLMTFDPVVAAKRLAQLIERRTSENLAELRRMTAN
jgi:hypothetical protein